MVYVVACVYILPTLLKSKIPEIIQMETGRKALISEIQVQPFPLSVKLQGFEIQEHNGQPFAAFDVFYIKLGLFKSIKQLALVFDEVSLKKPYVHIAKQENGAFNFQDLFKAQPDDKESEDSQPFPVNIAKLSLSDGHLVWEDASFATPVIEDITPVNIDIENFTTDPDKQARLGLSLALKSGGQLDWKGSASIKPLASEGHIKLDKVTLETISTLALPRTLPFNLKGYELLDADYTASYSKNALNFTVKKGSLEIRDFQFLEKGQNKPLIKMPVFSLQGIDFDFASQNIAIESVLANDADFQAWLNAQGINYQTLFPASKTVNNSANKTAANTAEPPGTPWTIKVKAIAFNNFGAVFEDRTLEKPAVMNLKPINFKLTNYTSESGANVPFQLDAVLNKTGSIKLVGDTVIQPFSAKIAVDAKKIALGNFQPYINKFARLDVADGKLSIQGNAVIATSKKGELDVTFKGDSEIDSLSIKDQPLKEKNKSKELIKIPVFALRGINFNLCNQELVLDSITAKDAQLQAWLNPEGIINYQSLLSISNDEKISIDKTVANTVKPQTATWNIKANNLAFTNFGLNFEDQTQKKPVTMNFKPINLKLTNYSNQSDVTLPVELSIGINKTGVVALKGNTVIEPLSAKLDLDVKNIGLENFQPYFDKFVRLDVIDGALHIDGNVSVAKLKEDKLDVKFKGDTGISSLLTRDQTQHKDLVKWQDLTLKDFAMDLLANRYTADELVIDKPYARVTIRKDKTVNFNEIIIKDQSKPESSPAKTAQNKPTDLNKPYFKLGKIQIRDGSSDFSDFSLILPFTAPIKSLDGGASGVSSEQKSVVTVTLKGNAFDLSPVDVKGEISPYLGDFKVEINFKGLPMPLVSPYMVQFAGYKVEKGKLTLSLKYNVTNKQLTASNSIFIDQFELGEKVDNPNAVSLPLKLAVALLKDSSGKIKIDVPITGSLDNPKFNIGSIVADALVNVLSKVVTSPFRALGSLIGSEKDMSTISFAAGDSSLNKQQQDKLDSLSKALKERPILNLDIKGAAFQEQDWPVLREGALYDQLKKRRAIEINKSADKKIRDEYVELSDDDYKRLLADMFIEKFPLLAEKSFLGTPQLMNPKAGDFYEIAKQKLFTIIKAEQGRLKRLASARALAIANYVVQKGGVPRQRVYILDSAVDPERNNKEIVSTLSLNAGG